jgi:methylase of polypeptide subunit release factors
MSLHYYANELTYTFFCRQHAKALRVVANDYVDEVLKVARNYIVDNRLSLIEIPNVEASFSEEVSFSYTKCAKCQYLQ